MSTAILLAAKDGENYIGELLESLATQSTRDFTVFLHDDGSTDDTLSIYAQYTAKDPDRFRVLDGPPQHGPRENFFYLMKNVEADYYLFADHDDVWKPEKVEREIAAVRECESKKGQDHPIAVFCNMKVVDEKLNEIAPSFVTYMGRSAEFTRYTEVLIDNPAAGCSIAMNRALRDIAVKCDDIRNLEMHDAWVMMVAATCGTLVSIPDTLILYRQHSGNELGAVTENAVQKIGRNLGDFFSGRMKQKKRDFFEISRRLAGEIIKLDDVDEEKRKVLQGYIDMRSHGRAYRIRYCRENGIRRANHNAWMLLWI